MNIIRVIFVIITKDLLAIVDMGIHEKFYFEFDNYNMQIRTEMVQRIILVNLPMFAN